MLQLPMVIYARDPGAEQSLLGRSSFDMADDNYCEWSFTRLSNVNPSARMALNRGLLPGSEAVSAGFPKSRFALTGIAPALGPYFERPA
jgi:hypothetical protein